MEYTHKNPNSHEIELHICNMSKRSWKLIKSTASAHTEGHFGKVHQKVWKQVLSTRQEMPWASKNPKKREGLAEKGTELKLFLSKKVQHKPSPQFINSGNKNDTFQNLHSSTMLTTIQLAIKYECRHASRNPLHYCWPL